MPDKVKYLLINVSFFAWLFSPTAACHSQSMWYDIHGAISVGVGSLSDVLDERPSRDSSEWGQPFSSAGALPLAPAAYSQDAAQTLQSI